MSGLKRLPRRVGIVSHAVPPATVGTAMRLQRMLRDVDPADYCLIVSRDWEAPIDGGPQMLPARYARLPPEWRRVNVPRAAAGAWVARRVNLWLKLVQRARGIARAAQAEGCRALYGFTGDLFDLPAARLAARRLRVPFYAGVEDYYAFQWTDPMEHRFARWAERFALKGAVRVVCVNELMADIYRRRYRVEAVGIMNPYEPAIAAPRPAVPWPAEPGCVTIVFTGVVYPINADSFVALMAALARMPDRRIELNLYGRQTEEDLARMGIRGPVRICGRGDLPLERVIEAQRRADILFLGLAFRGPIPEVVRTTVPFKTGEYLDSGRPILVNVPPGSFLGGYFREHECGLVVEQQDPGVLAAAIGRLIDDADLRVCLTANAAVRLREDFDRDRAQARFIEALR